MPVTGDEPAAPQALADVADQFDAEQAVDRAWQISTEAEIRRRVPAATAIECRHTLCRVTLVGSQGDVMAQSEQLAGEKSLRGIARSIQLTAPAPQPDGTLALRVYARFDLAQ